MAGPWDATDLGWQEDSTYDQSAGRNMLTDLIASIQPSLEKMRTQGIDQNNMLYRQRGLGNSGLHAQANNQFMTDLINNAQAQEQGMAMDTANFLESRRQNALNRQFQYRIEQLRPYLQNQYAPKQKNKWGGALGSLAGFLIAGPAGAAVGGQAGGMAGGGGTATGDFDYGFA